LGDIAARSPESILPYSCGNDGPRAGRRHCSTVLPQNRRVAARAHDLRGGWRGRLRYTYGGNIGMHLEHFEESELILIWGANQLRRVCISGHARRKPSVAGAAWSRSIRIAR
jgi:hypothetical protein